jgi:uncharacterized damage-inducible protein DinB
MAVKERLHTWLRAAREFSDGLLSNFKTPEQWTYQVHDKANHALWFAGHIAVVENFMISLVDPGRTNDKPGYMEKFGMGSMPSPDPADYPPIEEVMDYRRERREVLLDVLSGLSDDDLDKATPDGAPKFLSTFGAVFQLSAAHEAFHSGQVSVAARALGVPPRI